MYIRFLNIILLALLFLTTNSQQFNKKDFTVYRTKDGLSHKDVWSITQDAYGYIWLGTEKGLNRFDGSNFKQFYSDTLPESIPDDRVFNLKWINNEELGVLTAAGLNIINTKTLQMRNLLIPVDSLKNLSHVNRILDIAADKSGNIFIATSGGFYHFNNDRLIFRYDHADKTKSFGLDIIKASNNFLLLSTSEGLYIYNIEKKDMHTPRADDDPFLRLVASPDQRFRFTYTDENYFCASKQDIGLVLFDIRKRTSQVITEPQGFTRKLNFYGLLYRLNDTMLAALSSNKGFHIIHLNKQTGSWSLDTTLYFENDYCSVVFVDKNNRTWIGTSDGLYKQNKTGARMEQTQLPGEGGSLLKTITGLAVANNKLFAATALDGLYIFDKNQLLSSEHILYPKNQNYIPHLLKLNEDSLISAGIGFLINTRSLQYKKIEQDIISPGGLLRAIFMDSHERVYITKNNIDTLYFKDPPDKKFSSFKLTELKKIRTPTQIAEDNESNIWFGGHGLLRFNNQLKKIDLHLDSFPFIKRANKEVTSNIVFDKSGRMYFGIYRNGLIIYDIKEKKFSRLTRSDGLPDNVIKALYLHNNKTLWLTTENGLANYDLDSKKVSAFGITDGIPIDPSACTAFYYDAIDSLLYVAFSPVLVRFHPDKLKKNQAPPLFFVESIDIAGKETIYHPAESITVPYKYNSISVNVVSINFEDASQQLFAFRLLKNGNEAWQELGGQRKILFNDLPVGKHKLQMKVYIRNQSWPDQVKEITIIVKPPFWKTIWFYLLVALIIAGIFYYLQRRRINHITQKANIDKQLAQTEMKALHAQMNPHFIFNCLNSIREMILNNENEQASLYLSKFARLIRITLNQSSKPFVNLSDTIDYLERYIEMEKIRSDHFTYTIELGDDLQPTEIILPAMLIQPFIENAIWHGTLLKKNLDVHVSFRKKGNELVCVVEDNGIGIEESLQKKENTSTHPSVGIANIRQRIELLNEKYNLQSSVTIQDKKTLTPTNGTGTVVTLHLPIKTNESLWTT